MSEEMIITSGQPGSGPCISCGALDDTRMGFCWDCATSGEHRAAVRTVEQHLAKALENLAAGKRDNARFDIQWALERLTETGDYAPDGYFDHECPDWRSEASDV